MPRLDDQLARLAALPPAELRLEWERVYKTLAPRLTPELLRLGIGYRLQERTLGKLPARVARSLRQGGDGPTIKPGTQLVRSWRGRDISVIVTDTGFAFDGRDYSSLSAIAREVTGAGWSGPRFFGVATHG